MSPSIPIRFRSFHLVLALALFLLLSSLAGAAESATIGVEAEEFQYHGDWVFTPREDSSGGGCLWAGEEGAALPAATAVEIPRTGDYHLWVRALDFPDQKPGTRTCTVSVGGRKSMEVFGDSGQSGWTWEPGGIFALEAGPVLIGIHDISHDWGRVDAVLLTGDPALQPSTSLGQKDLPRTKPLSISPKFAGLSGKETAMRLPDYQKGHPLSVLQPSVKQAAKPRAVLENEHVRISFLPAVWENLDTIVPRLEVKANGEWRQLPTDPGAEAYLVVGASSDTTYKYVEQSPSWPSEGQTCRAEAGGVALKTKSPAASLGIWNAGPTTRFIPRSARMTGDAVTLEFHDAPAGSLEATWALLPGEHTARIRMRFVPSDEGQFAVGYQIFRRSALEQVNELLLPMMYNRKRLPDGPKMMMQCHTPTPLSIMEVAEEQGPVTWGVAGDPREIPFEWPDPKNPLFGFVIRDEEGMVWPGVYGPIPGTDRAKRKAGQAVEFHFRVLAQAGDWYAGFRTVADEVFQLRDYRQNHGVSLTQAALNMVDLLKDDDRGGWWEEPKGWYQVETLNGVTHSVPATLLSLYRLTGDEEIYRRRALPILEYMLSRTTSHFSPTPDNTGHYPAGGMQGPVNVFGTTTFSGLWELTNRYTDAFRQIALPEDGVRPSSGHTQDFEEWAERYVLTGDTQDLEKAKELADQYLKDEIETPPTKDLGHHPFFLIQFTPNWEGLLRMYEVTGEKRYLDGAVFGARQVMTGMWSQPVIPDGDIMVHPSGSFEGDKSWLILYKGPERYRLGWPRVPGDTPTRKAPAWSVSNVGLGFEQPSTYAGSLRSLAGRIIYQAAWTPNFQRLGAYTGDPQFVTYARNATVGRWGTYPGYYVVGFTDLVFNPRYPYGGPDVSFIYYHHLPVHLSWTIDYLVAEAYRLSKSQIEFPSKRQTGYAYFNGRVYGHAPGKVFGEENCWIWLKRGIVDIDNQQINYLTAHNGSNLFLYLMNQSPNEEKAEITFSPELLGYEPQTAQASIIREGSTSTHLAVKDDAVQITLPGCGAALITLEGVNVSIPAHQTPPAPEAGPVPSYVNTPCDLKNLAARAAAIQMGPDRWDAYVWCTAAFNEAREVTLTYTLDGQTHKITDTKYPFEFSIPVENPASTFEFHIEGKTPEEVEFRSPASSLGGAHARK